MQPLWKCPENSLCFPNDLLFCTSLVAVLLFIKKDSRRYYSDTCFDHRERWLGSGPGTGLHCKLSPLVNSAPSQPKKMYQFWWFLECCQISRYPPPPQRGLGGAYSGFSPHQQPFDYPTCMPRAQMCATLMITTAKEFVVLFFTNN